ncbi:hypothetical protein MKW98_030999 [Papaver atlanticum]|uniref:MINDY deubiquitinase domain-containing protein n=1 Tax=Papaver atlanticum TaxID=357466 RepID=A0AAD4XA85_9MAGN|nr:hypothetical protein MKW98_030999 [Papaver atlanticum]
MLSLDLGLGFLSTLNLTNTPELGVFRLLVLPLYHGWMVDPQDSDTAKSFESKPYNALLEEVASYYARNAGGEEKNVLQEDCGDHQKGKGDLEEEEALLNTLELCSIIPGTIISHTSAHSADHRLFHNTRSGVQLEPSLSQDSSAFSSCYTSRLSQ